MDYNFQYEMLWTLNKYIPLAPDGHYYEFGVLSGKAIDIVLDMTEISFGEDGQIKKNWEEVHNRVDKPFKGVIGFDSFVGLPKESDKVWNNPEWPEGAFNSLEVLGLDSIESVMSSLQQRWSKYKTKVELVPGFFSDSLTPELALSLQGKRASCVHVDCDIYQSTIEMMDWMFKYNLAMNDSIWRFDDWSSTPEWTAGESLAFLEITRKYNLNWIRFAANVFQLKG